VIVAIALVITFWEVVPRVNAQSQPRVRRRGAASIDAALSDPAGEQVHRMREGVLLTNELGTFSSLGDRISFQLFGQEEPLGVLENLALERVWKMLPDTRDRQWRVSGTVTEYRGRNYLLLHRAVLRTRESVAEPKP
jgi:hypothetical protein